MRAVDLIIKKRDGISLTDKEYKYLIADYLEGQIPDYQISALLMAIYYKGMTVDELAGFTKVMKESGDEIDLTGIERKTIDKHSTGGVGDKTSLIVAPILACFGLAVPKMSGRGLGHTGGTIDKLESIPGYSVELTSDEFKAQVNRIGLALISQTGNIAPADKKLYALRDVTGTVESIPLIASSIMSKKLASNAEYIILDVKCGSGAFMKNIADAEVLAKTMVGIGNSFGKKTRAIITNMNQPLGYAVGNALEVEEAIEVLRGEGPEDIRDLSVELACRALMLTYIFEEIDLARSAVLETILSGRALEKFEQLIESQGGVKDVVRDRDILKISGKTKKIYLERSGFVESIDVEKVGLAAMILGAGRKSKEDNINLRVGLKFYPKVGDKVGTDRPIAELYYDDETVLDEVESILIGAIKIGKEDVEREKLIYEVI